LAIATLLLLPALILLAALLLAALTILLASLLLLAITVLLLPLGLLLVALGPVFTTVLAHGSSPRPGMGRWKNRWIT
jgi:hypothetical protein